MLLSRVTKVLSAFQLSELADPRVKSGGAIGRKAARDCAISAGWRSSSAQASVDPVLRSEGVCRMQRISLSVSHRKPLFPERKDSGAFWSAHLIPAVAREGIAKDRVCPSSPEFEPNGKWCSAQVPL